MVRLFVALFLICAIESVDMRAVERTVVIFVPAMDDGRLEPTHDAIAFWNETFTHIGLELRLGTPVVVVGVPRSVET